MNFVCPSCRSELQSARELAGREVSCPVCGVRFTCKPNRRKWLGLCDRIPEVFRRHSIDELEDYFMVGTKETTPDIFGVKAAWPRPWMFARLLIVSMLLYWGFVRLWELLASVGMPNLTVVPTIIILGSFAVPLTTAVLFFELNIRRNVSLFQVLRLVIVGGVLSLALALVLFCVNPVLLSVVRRFLGVGWDAVTAGPIEETAKLLAVLLCVKASRYRYIHNGLLFGAAVGVGFAMFESAGYALNAFMQLLIEHGKDVNVLHLHLSMGRMEASIFVRAACAPVGHVVYTAITAGGLWLAKGGRPFSWRMILDWKFLGLFLIGMGLHMFWNSPLLDGSGSFGQFVWKNAYGMALSLPWLKIVIVLAVAVVTILCLVWAGIRQIREEQEGIIANG